MQSNGRGNLTTLHGAAPATGVVEELAAELLRWHRLLPSRPPVLLSLRMRSEFTVVSESSITTHNYLNSDEL
jgi:hypothetical protein